MPQKKRFRFDAIYPSASASDIYILEHTLQFDPMNRCVVDDIVLCFCCAANVKSPS